MKKEEIEQKIRAGRAFITDYPEYDEGDYLTDQYLHLPQPPLVKAAMRDKSEQVQLPTDFDTLKIDDDFLHVINSRRSHRVYTEEPVSLTTLSYLLWCTQGIKEIRGRSYATIRTVPCGGARHEFETYMIVRRVEGLAPGLYHYLPMNHSVELLRAEDDDAMKEEISVSLCEQSWASKADVVFYYSRRVALRHPRAQGDADRRRPYNGKPVSRVHVARPGRMRRGGSGHPVQQQTVRTGRRRRDDLLLHAGRDDKAGRRAE